MKSTTGGRHHKTVASDCCPACDSNDLDDSLKGIDPVCVECGLVISAADLVENSEVDPCLSDEVSEPEQRESWLEYCAVTNSIEKRMAVAFGVLEEYASELRLSSKTCDRASILFGEAAKHKLTHGRAKENVVGAVLYIAAHETEEVPPPSRLNELTGTDRSSVQQVTQLLRTELDVDYIDSRPETYVPFLCKDLGYEDRTCNDAHRLLREARDHQLTNGRSPTGLAGAALYCVSAGERSQRIVANAAGVSKETIRVRISEFREAGVIND